MKTKHKPVLLKELINSLNVKPQGFYLDATLGGGGHSMAIINRLEENGLLVCIDQDENAIREFTKVLISKGFIEEENTFTKSDLKVLLHRSNFANLKQVLASTGSVEFDGIIADLGMSTDQLHSGKGFSFRKNEKLDMRMSTENQVTAANLLNVLYKKELQELFEKYGDLSYANRLANEIINYRRSKPFETVDDLRFVINKVVPMHTRTSNFRLPEARVFQSLRIAVNSEMQVLESFLPDAFGLLKNEGVMGIITFHSGEDRIVKNFIKDLRSRNLTNIEKIIKPTSKEVEANPQSRSAKLRIIKKLITAQNERKNTKP